MKILKNFTFFLRISDFSAVKLMRLSADSWGMSWFSKNIEEYEDFGNIFKQFFFEILENILRFLKNKTIDDSLEMIRFMKNMKILKDIKTFDILENF
jgi:hypothetical protein